MKKISKHFFLLSVLLMCMFLVATLSLGGCKPATEEAVEDSENEEAVEESTNEEMVEEEEILEETTLRILSFRVEDDEFYSEFHEDFQQEYPQITVEYDVVPTADYRTILSARATTRDLDILAAGDANVRENDFRVYMADLGEPDFLEVYYEDALKAGQYEGKQYFVPGAGVGIVTFYNKQIFSDLGLDIPKTWDEFIEVCETIKAAGSDPIVLGGLDQWPINMVIIAIEAGLVSAEDSEFYTKMGTEETKFSDPGWVQIFERLEILSTYFQENAFGLAYGQAPGIFATGNAAMLIDGSWSIQQIEDANPDFEVGTFILPSSDKAENNKYIESKYGFGWSVFSDTKNMEAALAYLDFFSREDNYSKYVDIVRMLPTVKGVEITSPLLNEVAGLMVNQIPIYEDILFSNYSGAVLNWTNYGVLVAMGDMSPEDAAIKMQEDFIGSKDAWQ